MVKAGRRDDRSRSHTVSKMRGVGVTNLSITHGEHDGQQQRDELWISTRKIRSRDSPPKYGPLSPASQNTLVKKGRASSSAKMKKVDLLRSFDLQLAIM